MEPHHGLCSTRICSLVIAIVCCMDSVSRIHGAIQTSPLNQIVRVGGDVTFNCSSDITKKTITWIYKPPYKLMSASTFPLTISNGTQIRSPFGGKVEVQNYIKDNGSSNPVVFYNLIVKNVQFGDAGLYTCQDNNGYGQPVRGALLAVVDRPVCSLDRNVTTSSDHVTVNCTVSYCGNFTFIFNWPSITLTKSLPAMSTGQSQPPQYQNISYSVSSRTETIVNSFTTTIYTQTSLANVSNSSLNYTCYFNVTPEKPQIISDTIDNTVPTTSTITPFLVNISLAVSETGCFFQTSGNTPVNDDSTIYINNPIRLYTSNYPPPSYEWVVCYNASNCTTSTDELLLFSKPGIISSLNCTVTNRIEDRSYTCYKTLKNINVKSSQVAVSTTIQLPTSTIPYVSDNGADGQTRPAQFASIVAPAVIVPVVVIIGVIVIVWFLFFRNKQCNIFSNRGGTCFNGKSGEPSAQQGQKNLASNCEPHNGKNIDTNCSELKVAKQNGIENTGFTNDQNIKYGTRPQNGSQKNLSTNGL